ncbi:MAG TPA: F0F1 ATP synthase subunit A, partial [Gemmatimonadales bacterium]|nr:F0F1 ATP synthase subunit A [Gemmatimonadales bacterium]
MKRFGRMAVLALAVILAGSVPAAAQQVPLTKEAFHAAQGEDPESAREVHIMEHLADQSSLDYPCFTPSYICTFKLPKWPPVHIGPFAFDFSPTKHLVLMTGAAIIVMLVFVLSGMAIQRAQREGRPPRGFPGAMEAMTLYLRDEVILPNVGSHGEGYVPYLLSTFFFILVCNMLGLVPYLATPTGNIAVTGGLALLAFILIELSGMRTLGFAGYMHTIFFLPPG